MRFIIGFCLKRISSIALKGKAQSNIFMRMLPIAKTKSEEIFVFIHCSSDAHT